MSTWSSPRARLCRRPAALGLWVSLGLCGCTDGALGRDDDLGPFLRLSGTVDPDAPVSGDRTRGAVAWLWLREGELAWAVTEVPFEPLVYRYALTLSGPPEPEQGMVVPDEGLGLPGVTLLFGLPLLVEPDTADAEAPLELRIEAQGLLDWVRGAQPSLRGALLPEDQVAAVTAEHLLILLRDTDGAKRLDEAAWPPSHPLCRVDQAIEGLTLYREVGSKCGGWEPLAPAGARTEFQGVPMLAVP